MCKNLKNKVMHYYFEGPLSLSNIEDEKRVGLASQLSIQCKQCGHVNYVETSLTHKSAVTGGTVYNINTKAALAGLHTGVARPLNCNRSGTITSVF